MQKAKDNELAKLEQELKASKRKNMENERKIKDECEKELSKLRSNLVEKNKNIESNVYTKGKMKNGAKNNIGNEHYERETKETPLSRMQNIEIFGNDFDSPFNIEDTENQDCERRRTIKSFRGTESNYSLLLH